MSAIGVEELNKRRRQAVQLRLQGRTLPQIRDVTGLSAPTVINAYRTFLAKGWSGVAIEARGRRHGQGRTLTPAQETEFCNTILSEAPETAGLPHGLWTLDSANALAQRRFGMHLGERALAGLLDRAGLRLESMSDTATRVPQLAQWRASQLSAVTRLAREQGSTLIWCGQISLNNSTSPPGHLLVAQSLRGSRAWLALREPYQIVSYIDFLRRLRHSWPDARHILLHGIDCRHPDLADWIASTGAITLHDCPAGPRRRQTSPDRAQAAPTIARAKPDSTLQRRKIPMKLTHLQRLEAESIHIMREVVAEAENPVMLYSVGKDSATMLHLAKKAFYPSAPPFPLLHVDTTWKFRDMYAMRDRMAREVGMDLLIYQNPEAAELGINPFDHGSQIHTDMWKTQGLKQALDKYGFDAAFGGARRDEEKSRAKERIFSFRSAQHQWDPKNQRPELWSLYNARKRKGESIRVFPLSNWTELDIWQYIHLEKIPIVPLYFTAERPVVERDGMLIMVDDERMPLKAGEVAVMRKVRFRTLGCYPLTGAVESNAETLPQIIQEMLLARTSERQGRVIDHDSAASMEKKKQEGYF